MCRTSEASNASQASHEPRSGDGPVDAALKTIDRITRIQGRLLDYSLQAITVGKDAMGEVSLRVAFGEALISGKSASTDIVEASARAYLSCVNRLLTEKDQAGNAVARKPRAARTKGRAKAANAKGAKTAKRQTKT